MSDKTASPGLPSLPEDFQPTPEFRLLVACSWLAPESLQQNQSEKIKSLCAAGIDWDSFLSHITLNGIAPLAYAVLSRHAGTRVPQSVIEQLRTRNSQSRRQALFQTAELVRLIRLFAEQNISVVPLKGVLLSHQIYNDLGMRYSVDLDLLIQPDQVDRAEQIMVGEGYHCNYHGTLLPAAQKRYVRHHIHHYDFVHEKSGLHVEIHWSQMPWLPQQIAVLWDHVVKQEWHGMHISHLDYDALLLFLCDHGARHLWLNLKWLGDVARLLVLEQTAWGESLVALAKEIDQQRTLAHAALLAHWLYDVPLSSVLQNLIREERQIIQLTGKTLLSISLGNLKHSSILNVHTAWRIKQLRPSLPYHIIMKSMFISLADYQVLPLPDSLFWLYYPIRPLLWFWRNHIRK